LGITKRKGKRKKERTKSRFSANRQAELASMEFHLDLRKNFIRRAEDPFDFSDFSVSNERKFIKKKRKTIEEMSVIKLYTSK